MIEIVKVSYDQKSVLRNLLELYKYDFTEFDPEDMNESGLYEYMYLDHYWTEAGRHPFFIRVEGKLAGFALVRELGLDEVERKIYSIAEFFVMKKYRRDGVGKQAAHAVFDLFRGRWEAAVMEENVPAQHFWRKTVHAYKSREVQEIRKEEWDGPIVTFVNE
ncbi:GNAT family N-acetyltransferase [Paenibacillus sp. N1-5-1-14]|uniref:GNAT family N-acetyltransferase n=1 Tax=Paenibacillus radicibacter TaxID=2972488 RepID=UPI002158CE9A|nr:GNAT family N-acetyltransferase [Paenibacillus radicibacter]MCR8644391.1 GNAT family N-acetyltransferase [Paenibacillus radicibacter]